MLISMCHVKYIKNNILENFIERTLGFYSCQATVGSSSVWLMATFFKLSRGKVARTHTKLFLATSFLHPIYFCRVYKKQICCLNFV
jgi:hypothetical protein